MARQRERHEVLKRRVEALEWNLQNAFEEIQASVAGGAGYALRQSEPLVMQQGMGMNARDEPEKESRSTQTMFWHRSEVAAR